MAKIPLRDQNRGQVPHDVDLLNQREKRQKVNTFFPQDGLDFCASCCAPGVILGPSDCGSGLRAAGVPQRRCRMLRFCREECHGMHRVRLFRFRGIRCDA